MASKSELFSYIVRSDSGFAPNPYGGVCTLACCKPKIRNSANIGVWVIGTTPSPNSGRLVFAMQVTRTLTFELYFEDPKYARKKNGPANPRGDSIYRKGISGGLEQVPKSAHDERHKKGDLSANRVLISETFFYFGGKAPLLPSQFGPLVHTTRGHRRIRTGSPDHSIVVEFLEWLSGGYSPGVQGEPRDEKIICLPPEEDDTE
jgi:hypothetical protein